jgi:hypothetical protein
MSTQLNELRLQVERLDYDNKEGVITIDILKEQNQDVRNELEDLKKVIADLKASQKDASADDKEKRKQEKMALMMAKFDTVNLFTVRCRLVSHRLTAGCIFRERRTTPGSRCEIRQHRHGQLIDAR